MNTYRDQWEIFRNFLYNELAISKEDIREWIREAVEDQAKLLIQQSYEKFNIEYFLKEELLNNKNYYMSPNELNPKILQLTAQLLTEKINISLKEDQNENK